LAHGALEGEVAELTAEEYFMAEIRMQVPDDLRAVLGGVPEDVGREILLAAAFQWCGRGELSTSQAARIAGLTHAGFLEAATQRQAVLYDYDQEEIHTKLARPLPEGVDVAAVQQRIARAQAARR
jgi:hypothetical protein